MNQLPDKNGSGSNSRSRTLIRQDRSQVGPHRPNYYYELEAAASSSLVISGKSVNDSLVNYIVNPDDVPSGSIGPGSSYFSEDLRDLSPSHPEAVGELAADAAKRHAQNPNPTVNSNYRHNSLGPSHSVATSKTSNLLIEDHKSLSIWAFYCAVITLPVTPWLLTKCGVKSPQRQEAWREKIGWISLILLISLVIGFFTIGFHSSLCGWPAPRIHFSDIAMDSMVIHGRVYNLSTFRHSSPNNRPLPVLLDQYPDLGGKDASFLFQNVNANCKNLIIPSGQNALALDKEKNLPWYMPCSVINAEPKIYNIYALPRLSMQDMLLENSLLRPDLPQNFANFTRKLDQTKAESYQISSNNMKSAMITAMPGYGCHLSASSRTAIYSLAPSGLAYYTWDDIENDSSLAVFRGDVISLDRLKFLNTSEWELSSLLSWLRENRNLPTDITDLLATNSTSIKIGNCLTEIAKVGVIDEETSGCLLSKGVLYISLTLILSIISLKFFFALYFEWFVSWKELSSSEVPLVPETSSVDVDCEYGVGSAKLRIPSANFLHIVCLVTVYREGRDRLYQCLDSLFNTTYPGSHKTMIVVCDGMVQATDDDQMTFEFILELMRPLDGQDSLTKIEDLVYVSVGSGNRRLNRATLYYGYYKPAQGGTAVSKVGIICIVKQGHSFEREKKGNRGKRDSQVMVMSFLQHVFFADRMTTLENELYLAIMKVSKCSPDCFEAIMMVDADTKVFPDSLASMAACLKSDPFIMGLCGETMIDNQQESWVAMIQVFEYFISHHLNKSFESVFGGVTCLPGCFCMYRIKVRKGHPDQWLPIIANPDIVVRYSVNVVDTLHLKNLLLLGEDRYLSTLMLKTFPRRKLIFLPAAKCTTIVPVDFSVLMDQRRRWINSTIHNLIELMLVRELCGVFCISMQFVVMAELLGTLTLPAAMVFTVYLAISSIYRRPIPWMPLVLLLCILGMPAILVFLTAHRWTWFVWMLIYLVSLPIWNLILPLNACKKIPFDYMFPLF